MTETSSTTETAPANSCREPSQVERARIDARNALDFLNDADRKTLEVLSELRDDGDPDAALKTLAELACALGAVRDNLEGAIEVLAEG